MTHDLRTPLSGIQFMIENALEIKNTEERNKCLNFAMNNAGLLMNLINDILDFS